MKLAPRKKGKIIILELLCLAVVSFSLFIINQNQLVNYADVNSGTPPSVNINDWNNWNPPNNWYPPSQVPDFQTKVNILAKKDSIYLTDAYTLSTGLTTSSLKALNPKLKIYRAYDLICKHPWDSDWNAPHTNTTAMTNPLTFSQIEQHDWWLKDASGNIIQIYTEYPSVKDTRFIDVGQPGVKEAMLTQMLANLNGKGYDGVAFDYLTYNLMSRWVIGRGSTPPIQYQVSGDTDPNQKWFDNAYQPFFTYMADGLHAHGYRIIGNDAGIYGATLSYENFQRSKVDGSVYESFGLYWDSRWLPADSSLPYDQPATKIAAMYNDPLEIWVAEYGLRFTDPQFRQKADLDLAMYYIGLPTDPTLRSKRSFNYYGDSNVFWDNLWDFYIGTPIGTYSKIAGNDFWSRQYSQGFVLLNYDASKNFAYTLTSQFKDSAGKIYFGKVTLAPHTALILQTVATQSSTSTKRQNTTRPTPSSVKHSPTNTPSVIPTSKTKKPAVTISPQLIYIVLGFVAIMLLVILFFYLRQKRKRDNLDDTIP